MSSDEAAMLLAGPLVCTVEHPSTARLLLPSQWTRCDDALTRTLSLTIMPIPSSQQLRHEHDALIAAQYRCDRAHDFAWTLKYSVAERRLTWTIPGRRTADPAASSQNISSLVLKSEMTLPADEISSDVTLSCVEPVPIFAQTRVDLVWSDAAQCTTLVVNGKTAASARCSSSPSGGLFIRSPLVIGGGHSSWYSAFVGLIADVHASSRSTALVASINLVESSISSHLRSSLGLAAASSLPVPPPARVEPIYSLAQLHARQPNSDPLRHTPIATPAERCRPKSRRRVIHCHDMAGGFVEDYDTQNGLPRFHAYNFQFWKFLDIFIYFSHARIAVPPTMWITAAHRNGVQILANFCTEWTDGERENIRLIDVADINGKLGWKEHVHRMVALAVEYNFDGWFLNIEAALQNDLQSTPEDAVVSSSSSSIAPNSSRPSAVAKLVHFIAYLTEQMHRARPDSLVLWYDSIRASDGAVKWQSRLNEENECFFDACDGIFTDYHWQEDWPASSALAAGDRLADVFTGVDLYGRGSFGGGGFDAMRACEVILSAQTSLALFAPAWTYEGDGCSSRDEFLRRERRLWLGDNPWREVPLRNAVAISHDTESNLAGWKLDNGGQGWSVALRDAIEKSYCFCTSHEWCTRQQTIDVIAAGFTAEHLDSQPSIMISTEYAGTPPNLRDHYKLTVSLLTAAHEELARFSISLQSSSAEWQSIVHTFRDYGAGLRFIRWQDGGKDEEKWAGHFGIRIGASRIQINSSNERRACIADYVDRKMMPFHAFTHSFNTGNGRSFYLRGEQVTRRAIATDKASAGSSSTAWFNLALQDCQTILASELLCDGVITTTDAAARSINGRIAHDAAYDGGSCFEIRVQPKAADEAQEFSEFDCFEFGPCSSSASTDWHVQYVYARPSATWNLALRFELDDAERSQYLIEDRNSDEEKSPSGAWRVVDGVLPASFLARGSIVKLRVQVRHHSAVSLISASDLDVIVLRLGQVRVAPVSSQLAVAAATGEDRVPTIEVTRFVSIESLVGPADTESFRFEWSSPTDAEVSSWDVFIDAAWQSRVLMPRYFIDGLHREQLRSAVASSSLSAIDTGFRFSVRPNRTHGALSLAFPDDICVHVPWSPSAPA